MKVSDDLVTIATFHEPMRAHMAKLELDAHGIESILLDENFSMLRPIYAVICGGVRLQTLASDAPDAREILQWLEEEPTSVLPAPIRDSAQDVCPDCGSNEVVGPGLVSRYFMLSVVGLLALMAFVSTGVEPGFWKTHYRCRRCGARWGIPVARPRAQRRNGA